MNEKPPIDQKESGINRIVGFNPDEEKEFLQYFKNKFEKNQAWPLDMEKSPELEKLIERINVEMHDFLARYGIDAIEIPADNVHVLDRAKLTEDEVRNIVARYGTENGFYRPLEQSINVLKDYNVNKLSFLQTLVHEMLHLQGFYSYQKSDEEDSADLTLQKEAQSASMNIRRSGFSIGTKDGERRLFHYLNESVITELEIRFEKSYMYDWPELETELKIRDEYVEQTAKRDNVPLEEAKQLVAGIKGDENSGYILVSYGYNNERKRLNYLIDEIYEKNENEFESREEVFNLFADATMNGKLLPTARLIEKTYGKGSFRVLGEKSADKPNPNESI